MASPPVVFFLLVFLLSIPFAVLGAVTGRQLYPSIPISALGFVAPVTAAALLRYRDDGAAGVMALLRRAGEWRRIRSPRWWLTIFLLMPAVTAAPQGLLRLARRSVPGPHLALPGALLLFLAFVVAALGEELGWSGYALDPLEQDLSAIGAALVLGVVWAAWHIVAMVQAGQSGAWIAWGCLDMVATRVVMVWIYNNTGRSVLAVALYHAVANLSIKTWFPGGSYEGERVVAVMLTALAGLVALAWGPRTLAGRGGTVATGKGLVYRS